MTASPVRLKCAFFKSLLCSFIVVLSAFQSFVYADILPRVKSTLRSASELDYPPFAIVEPDGSAAGFSVDLLQAAAEAAGFSVTFTVGPWNELKDQLARGEIDVLPLMSFSEERDQIYDFTAPYLKMGGTVFVRQGNTQITDISDLSSKELLVMKGDTAEEYALQQKLSDTIIATDSYEEAFRLLASGKHDAVVAQQLVGLQIIKKLGLSNVIPLEEKSISSLKPMTVYLDGFEQKFCFAVAEGNAHLLAVLNEGLAILYINGTYDALYEKWFAPILPKPEVPFRDVLKQSVLLLVPILLVAALGGVWYFRRLLALRTRHLHLEIRQRETAEEKLAKANAIYARAQQIGRIGNWQYDIAAKRFWGSDEAKRFYGLNPEMLSFTEEEVENCIPEKEPVHQAMVDLIKKNIPYDLEFEIISRDSGERRVLRSLAELQKDEQGNPVLVEGIVQDITEQKRAETALRQSEERFRRAIVNSPIPKMIHDEAGNVLQISAGWKELSGYSLEDIPTLADWVERAYDEQAKLALTYIEDLFVIEDSVKNGAWEITAKDGTKRIWDFQTTPLGEQNDGKRVLLSIANDITERIQAEESLQASEQMHRSLVQGLPDVIIRFDRQGRHLFVSDNVVELIEKTAEECTGKTHRQIGLSEEHCLFWENALHRVFQDGNPLELEYSFRGRSGQVISSLRFIPEYGSAAGTVTSVVLLSRDITAQRKAERNYQNLFNEMLEGFAQHEIICDDDGVPCDYRFLLVNPSYEKLTGLKAADIVGRTVREVLPQIEEYHIENFGRVALSGEPAHIEYYSTDLGKHFEARVFRSAPFQFAAIITDITERLRGEEERTRLRAQLQQAQKMEAIGTLAGGIAHDFNNILGAMIGYAEMVREDSPEGSLAAQDLDQVLAAGSRAKALVKQILAFSRQTEANKIPLQPVILVKEATKMLRSSIPATIAIEQSLQRDCGLINADPTQIQQILINLCTNAFHAMEEKGGVLTIALQRISVTETDVSDLQPAEPGDYVQLTVADTGTGISPEILEKIFDPYFTTKEVGKGTGMGLAIIHGIVTSYGGFIHVASQPGKGSVFRINLPVWNEEYLPDQPDDEFTPHGVEQVLFVDDEELLAEMGRTMLERLGYRVTARNSSLEAYALFEKQPDSFDVLITDQTMPGMTGFELAEKVLQIRPDFPIILCTGYSSVVTEEKALAAGIKGFALKPLAKHDIAVLIRDVLEQSGKLL